MNTSDSMRGLFFIIKGGYVPKASPSFTNRVTGEEDFIGGYDPDREDTREWYMVLDRKCYHCVACGSDYEKVLGAVKSTILKHKGQAKKYFKHLSDTTSDDYYEVHYLGRKELTPEQRTKKAEGRCPRTSPIMRCVYEEIDRMYGDFYSEDIEVMEKEAYEALVDEKPVNKSRKIFNRARKSLVVKTPDTKKADTKKKVLKKKEDVTPAMVIKKPVKRSLKRLKV